jgi:hypothetical protein
MSTDNEMEESSGGLVLGNILATNEYITEKSMSFHLKTKLYYIKS